MLLVLGVGLSFFLSLGPTGLVSLTIAFTLSFFLHELAHKFLAQHFGLWAEFRLTMQGVLITLVSTLLPLFKIGPVVNIILSALCAIVAVSTQNISFWVVSWINALFAFFNLIPFGVMDGLKVFWWNKTVWTLAFIASIMLMTYAYGPALAAL